MSFWHFLDLQDWGESHYIGPMQSEWTDQQACMPSGTSWVTPDFDHTGEPLHPQMILYESFPGAHSHVQQPDDEHFCV